MSTGSTPKRTRATRKTSDTKKQEVIFDFDRETKGTYRFREPDTGDGKRPIMGTIWLRKDVAEKLGVTDEDSGVKVTLEPDVS
jgi:hypothetical protein